MSFLRQFLGSSSWVRALMIFVVAWGFLVYIFVSKLSTQPSTIVDQDNTVKRMNQALQMLEHSKQRNDELRQMISDFMSDQVDKQTAQKLMDNLESKLQRVADGVGNQNTVHTMEPSLEYEQLRRRVRSNTQELWNYFSDSLGKIRKKVLNDMPDLADEIQNILQMGAENKRSLIHDIERMTSVDGYENWRHQEATNLSNLVQKRLNYLQNPKDCKNARKLVCKLNKGCGYGCQLHHVVYCFIVAYATERTMILKSKGWRYHKGGWEEVFLPISDTCTDVEAVHANNWPGQHDTQVLVLPIIDSLIPRPPYLPLSIPEDLAPRLKRLHGDPIVWWVGQFLKYLLKPKHSIKEMLENGMDKLGWKKPIVGVHVRRTDKVGTEAAFHSLDEYMTHVEDYYLTMEINGTNIDRRIFLASDDARVIEEARKKYPNYDIVGDPDVARMAAVSTRYTDSSLNGIILDIHMLSLCDYLVCTFSSQVCRVAYEIMQTLYPDAAHRFKSLDDIYYYGGQNPHDREAVIAHSPKNHDEIHLRPGDLAGVAGNHWNGFSKGKNKRTNQMGLFPSFKVVDKVETVKLPTYPKA